MQLHIVEDHRLKVGNVFDMNSHLREYAPIRLLQMLGLVHCILLLRPF